MDTPEKDYKDDTDWEIRLKSREVSKEQIKKSWDAVYKAIMELEEKKAESNKETPTQS